jgi:hypothetical protein
MKFYPTSLEVSDEEVSFWGYIGGALINITLVLYAVDNVYIVFDPLYTLSN